MRVYFSSVKPIDAISKGFKKAIADEIELGLNRVRNAVCQAFGWDNFSHLQLNLDSSSLPQFSLGHAFNKEIRARLDALIIDLADETCAKKGINRNSLRDTLANREQAIGCAILAQMDFEGDDAAVTSFLFEATDDNPDLAPSYFPYAVQLERKGSLVAANWLALYGWSRHRDGASPLLADKDEQNRILARVAMNGATHDEIRFTAIELGDRYYEEGESGSPSAYIEAHKWYEVAYRDGQDPEAAILIGYLYEEGKGVPKDLPSAVDWFLRVTELPEPGDWQCVNLDDWPAYHQEGWRNWDYLGVMLGDATPEERLRMIDSVNQSTQRASRPRAEKSFQTWLNASSQAFTFDFPRELKEMIPEAQNIHQSDIWEVFAQIMPIVTAEQSVEFARRLNSLQQHQEIKNLPPRLSAWMEETQTLIKNGVEYLFQGPGKAIKANIRMENVSPPKYMSDVYVLDVQDGKVLFSTGMTCTRCHAAGVNEYEGELCRDIVTDWRLPVFTIDANKLDEPFDRLKGKFMGAFQRQKHVMRFPRVSLDTDGGTYHVGEIMEFLSIWQGALDAMLLRIPGENEFGRMDVPALKRAGLLSLDGDPTFDGEKAAENYAQFGPLGKLTAPPVPEGWRLPVNNESPVVGDLMLVKTAAPNSWIWNEVMDVGPQFNVSRTPLIWIKKTAQPSRG